MGVWDGIATAETDQEASTEDMLQIVSFTLGAEEFAVDILLVQEINRMVEITSVPRAPGFVKGVINLRGKIVPVLDLRERFGFPCAESTAQSRIMVVRVENRVFGLLVDSVSEVLRLPVAAIEPPPALAAGIGAAYIKGVGRIEDRLLILLDLAKVLAVPEGSEEGVTEKGVGTASERPHRVSGENPEGRR